MSENEERERESEEKEFNSQEEQSQSEEINRWWEKELVVKKDKYGQITGLTRPESTIELKTEWKEEDEDLPNWSLYKKNGLEPDQIEDNKEKRKNRIFLKYKKDSPHIEDRYDWDVGQHTRKQLNIEKKKRIDDIEYKKRNEEGQFIYPNRIVFAFNSGNKKATKDDNWGELDSNLRAIMFKPQGLEEEKKIPIKPGQSPDVGKGQDQNQKGGGQENGIQKGKAQNANLEKVDNMLQLNSFEGTKLFMRHYEETLSYRDQKPDIMNLAQQGKSATKRIVLTTIMKQLQKYVYLDNILFYYNGHGSSSKKPEDKFYCGKWFCENDELIGAADILEIIRQKTRVFNNGKQINLVFFSDCCGSAGQYWHIIYLAKNGSPLVRNIQNITFYAPCDYYQDSIGTQKGGLFTLNISHKNYAGVLKHKLYYNKCNYQLFMGGEGYGNFSHISKEKGLPKYYLEKAGAFDRNTGERIKYKNPDVSLKNSCWVDHCEREGKHCLDVYQPLTPSEQAQEDAKDPDSKENSKNS